MTQLPLGIGLRHGASFLNFVRGSNGEPLEVVRALAGESNERVVYLWGERGTGKTHLVQALCRDTVERDDKVACIALRSELELRPEVLQGLEGLSLICIDDVDAVAGIQSWENALFRLYNAADESGSRLLITARAGPRAAGFMLPDLASRLAMGLVLKLRALKDAGRCEVLQRRASERGLELSDEVATFLIRRHPRDMHSLLALLDRLDRSAMAAQRRLTVPFVRRMFVEESESTRNLSD